MRRDKAGDLQLGGRGGLMLQWPYAIARSASVVLERYTCEREVRIK